MRLIDADKFKENFIKRFHCDPLVTGWKDSENLSFVLNEEPTVSIKELENLRETTTFFFVEYGKDSSWVCDRCVEMLKDLKVQNIMVIIFAHIVAQR